MDKTNYYVCLFDDNLSSKPETSSVLIPCFSSSFSLFGYLGVLFSFCIISKTNINNTHTHWIFFTDSFIFYISFLQVILTIKNLLLCFDDDCSFIENIIDIFFILMIPDMYVYVIYINNHIINEHQNNKDETNSVV